MVFSCQHGIHYSPSRTCDASGRNLRPLGRGGRQLDIAVLVESDHDVTLRFCISRRLVALMEREMGTASVVGSGSEFWFTLADDGQHPGAPASAAATAPSNVIDIARGLLDIQQLWVDKATSKAIAATAQA